MKATWSALAAWPYLPRPPATVPFRSGWEETLHKLEAEIEAVGGEDVIIGVVCDPSQISLAGVLKAGGRTAVRHPGTEVSFTARGARLSFHTDAYATLSHNLRAVALGLEALRAVNRYGITSGIGEQYAGFAQLTAGGPDPGRGKLLVEAAGGIREAQRRHHPDHGGDPRDFVDVQAYASTRELGL